MKTCKTIPDKDGCGKEYLSSGSSVTEPISSPVPRRKKTPAKLVLTRRGKKVEDTSSKNTMTRSYMNESKKSDKLKHLQIEGQKLKNEYYRLKIKFLKRKLNIHEPSESDITDSSSDKL